MTVAITEAVQHSIDFIELWRTLGEDYAKWERGMPEHAHPAFCEGYAVGQGKHKAKNPDRFVRKWLQIRFNALKRKRVVDKTVTAEFLKEIDVPVCPVTLINLTYAEQTESDWSIDRVNNDGAYAPENLIVLSTKANKKKGNKTYDDVCGLAMKVAASDGLEPSEWYRLAMLMQGACTVGTVAASLPSLPLVTTLPPHCTRPDGLQLQYVIHKAASKLSERKKVERRLNPLCGDDLTVEKLKTLIDTVRDGLRDMRKQGKYEYDVWLLKKVTRLLVNWMVAIGPQRKLEVWRAARELAGGHQTQESEVEAWALPSGGRLPK